jgi:hypothetical protein
LSAITYRQGLEVNPPMEDFKPPMEDLNFEKQTCQECGETFELANIGFFPGIGDTQQIVCPHCGALWGSRRSTSIIVTRKTT